jgi:hypothetical protein
MPSQELADQYIVRVNDVNDSSHGGAIEATRHYPYKFYNTSEPSGLDRYPGPVVLTLNPDVMTDSCFWEIFDFDDPHDLDKLMFVRLRANTWNIELLQRAVDHYRPNHIPIVMTFMAYYETPIPLKHRQYYTHRKRTLNEYWAITQEGWDSVMAWFDTDILTCGVNAYTHACKCCRNCEKLFHKYPGDRSDR